MKLINIFLLLIIFSGCENKKVQHKDLQTFEYNFSYAFLAQNSEIENPVNPDDTDVKKHSRDKCPTNGWITHGDGHKTRCPDCDPPYLSSDKPPKEEKIPEKEIKPVEPKSTTQRKYFYDQRTRKWYYYE